MITAGPACLAVKFFDELQLDGTSPARMAMIAADSFVSHMLLPESKYQAAGSAVTCKLIIQRLLESAAADLSKIWIRCPHFSEVGSRSLPFVLACFMLFLKS
jgi:hypothetical protein